MPFHQEAAELAAAQGVQLSTGDASGVTGGGCRTATATWRRLSHRLTGRRGPLRLERAIPAPARAPPMARSARSVPRPKINLAPGSARLRPTRFPRAGDGEWQSLGSGPDEVGPERSHRLGCSTLVCGTKPALPTMAATDPAGRRSPAPPVQRPSLGADLAWFSAIAGGRRPGGGLQRCRRHPCWARTSLWDLALTGDDLQALAQELGRCALPVCWRPQLCFGRGERLEPFQLCGTLAQTPLCPTRPCSLECAGWIKGPHAKRLHPWALWPFARTARRLLPGAASWIRRTPPEPAPGSLAGRPGRGATHWPPAHDLAVGGGSRSRPACLPGAWPCCARPYRALAVAM